jgi:hypothetical protein
MNRGKRKKLPKLDTVKKLAVAIRINDGLYIFEAFLAYIITCKQSSQVFDFDRKQNPAHTPICGASVIMKLY